MPRANRYFVPGHVWHITHRCHRREFLLDKAVDRQRWLHWLRIATARYGLCVLNYIATRNHIHLLVRDRGRHEIVAGMRLAAARVAQEYNIRNDRHGSFWQDRYHATAVDSDGHLDRCFTYIDLNMVRAGAVRHPSEWVESGFREIQYASGAPPIIDLAEVAALFDTTDISALRAWRADQVDDAIRAGRLKRESDWSERVAVGGDGFIESIKRQLGPGALRRRELASRRRI